MNGWRQLVLPHLTMTMLAPIRVPASVRRSVAFAEAPAKGEAKGCKQRAVPPTPPVGVEAAQPALSLLRLNLWNKIARK